MVKGKQVHIMLRFGEKTAKDLPAYRLFKYVKITKKERA